MIYLAKAFLTVALVAAPFGADSNIDAATGSGQVLFVAFIALCAGSLLASGPRLARLAAHRLVDPFIR